MNPEFIKQYEEKYGEKFISLHGKEDVNRLRLSLISKFKSDGERAFLDFALLQIEAKRKYSAKLKDILTGNPNFLFPSMLAGEQASHWLVARYHALVVGSLPGYPFRNLIDITAGLGVDFMTIESNAEIPPQGCVAIEQDPQKAEILRYNVEKSDCRGAVVVEDDSMNWLAARTMSAERKLLSGGADAKNRVPTIEADPVKTVIFADPARRAEGNIRLYDPTDCLPDIAGNFSLLSDNADSILIKYSPMLDLSKVLNTFPDVRRIHIVCVKNECKEVLVEIIKDAEFEGLRVVNLSEDSESIFDIPADEWHSADGISFIDAGELEKSVTNGTPLYLYEPNAGMMKSGAWGYLSKRFPGLKKADLNTHLFISPARYDEFPGRITKIESVINKKGRKSLKGEKINVVCRNYPAAPEKVESDLKLKPSSADDRFLYAFTVAGKPVQVLTRKG